MLLTIIVDLSVSYYWTDVIYKCNTYRS